VRKRESKATTIHDIGRTLGLSAMTVSRALNGHPEVKNETRQRVLSQAAKLNYRPNRWARSLVTSRSHMIGIVIPDLSHGFFAEIIHGVQETIEPAGYNLMLCHSAADTVREQKEIEMLLGSRVDGLLIASNRSEDSPGPLAELLRHGVPFVLLDRFFPDLDCVRVRSDDFETGRLAVEHLISLGHRDIAHIGGPEVSTSRLRRDGYAAALKAYGIPSRSEWMAAGDFTVPGGYEAARRLLARRRRPTALFAANDPSAIGAIHACRNVGLDVPGDISIVGAGCIENSFYPTPFLTTIDWPRRELGAEAGRILVKLVAGGPQPDRLDIIYRPSLLVRKSTGPPKSVTPTPVTPPAAG
jgi:LacI family transcriptional regulator